jgi:hypothetical protein
LTASITQCRDCNFVIDKLAEDLEAFCDSAPQDDDISAAEIPLQASLLPGWEKDHPATESEAEQLDVWLAQGQDDFVEFELTLHGTQLRRADPVPILINSIQETAGLHEHRRPLFTILTELYVNALDHGVLQLNSELKQGEDGFSAYFQQREHRLNALTEGKIRISLRIHNLHGGGYMAIKVEDSGRGFNFQEMVKEEVSGDIFSGRGIMLVNSLCKQLNYSAPGNKVEAIYIWKDAESD